MTMEATGTVRDETRSGVGEFGQVEVSWAVVSDVGLLREPMRTQLSSALG